MDLVVVQFPASLRNPLGQEQEIVHDTHENQEKKHDLVHNYVQMPASSLAVTIGTRGKVDFVIRKINVFAHKIHCSVHINGIDFKTCVIINQNIFDKTNK